MSRSFRNNSRSFSNQPKRESTQRVRHQQQNISQAETSQDQHGVKIVNDTGRSTQRKESHQSHQGRSYYQKDTKNSHYHHHRQQSYSHSRPHAKLDTSQSSTTRQSSRPRNSSASFKNNTTSKSKTFINHPLDCIFPPPPPSPKNHYKNTISLQDDQHTITKILTRIASLDYQKQDYLTLKSTFIKSVSHHVKIIGKLPQPVTPLGEFHQKWIQILKKQENINLSPLFESYFVRYRQKLKRNVDKFQGQLNIFKDSSTTSKGQNQNQKQVKKVLDQQRQKQREANMELKRYRSLIDQQLRQQGQQYNQYQNQQYQRSKDYKRSSPYYSYNNNNQSFLPLPSSTPSTTKIDTMLLYQQLKQQLHLHDLQNHITQTVQHTINQWKQKTSQLQQQKSSFQPICDMDLMFQTQHEILQKWNDIEQLEKRKQAMEQLEKQRVRQRSPMSSRFRMMHQCQNNCRRQKVQMACMFLNCDSFYYLQDLEILNVQETIFSDTQQIVVMKAYGVEYDPKVGMMRLKPKIKTLISVYKFSGLSELIRLAKTYGKFDGIVVYPESFDIQKYLANNKDLSLVKDRFLKQVKGQLPIQQRDETMLRKKDETTTTKDKLIEY